MPLVEMPRLLQHARENSYAVGYFEAWNLESLLAVRDAAERSASPVIIGFNGKFLGNRARRRPEDVFVYGSLGRAVAERAGVPVALILNEADDLGLLLAGLDAGFTVVMHEGCALEESIRINMQLTKAAHARGASVEAELGELPTTEGHAGQVSGGAATDPGEAERFVARTGVDALAVSVGNVHVLEKGTSSLDFALLAELVRRVPVPLVLHGGTGIGEENLRRAIAMGVSKVNVGTVLRRAFINSIRGYLRDHDVDRLDPGEVTSTGGSQDMLAAARARVAAEIERLMVVFGSAGKARAFPGR
jgi:ketose-bisphosphate aldolase